MLDPATRRRRHHISKPGRNWCDQYGKFLWLDPGEKEVQDYSLSVIMDVVKRYDVDGIHFDDYFYPYKEKDAAGREMDFPDDASWRRFGAGGKLSRDDWRRENVNRVYRAGLPVHQVGQAVGEIRHQPLRHLAPGISGAGQGL